MDSDIVFNLSAQNSSGEQRLYISRDGDELFFTLTGDYKGKKIQIDFDILTITEMEDLESALSLIIEDYHNRD